MKDEIIKRLQVLPKEITRASYQLESARKKADVARKQLLENEARITPTLDGKNAEIRRGQLFEQTKHLHTEIAKLEEIYRERLIALEQTQNEFKAARYIARLLASDI